MTMPHARTRAVIETKKFLEELRFRYDVPCDIKQTATWCLRHYPQAQDIKNVAHAQMQCGSENPFGTSENYDEHMKNINQFNVKNSEQT